MGCGTPKSNSAQAQTTKPATKTKQSSKSDGAGKEKFPVLTFVLIVCAAIVFVAGSVVYQNYQNNKSESYNQKPSTSTSTTKYSNSTQRKNYDEEKKKVKKEDSSTNKNTSKKSSTNVESSAGANELSIGNVKLGMTIKEMHDAKGKENSKKTVDGITYYYYPGIKIGSEGNRIDFIQSTDDNVCTSQHIYSGDWLDDVVNAYGENAMKTNYGDLVLYEYNFKDKAGRKGILRFAADRQTKQIDYISVRIADYKG